MGCSRGQLGEQLFDSGKMPTCVELTRDLPRTQLQMAMVSWIPQGAFERCSKRARTETPPVRELTSFPGPQPIHDPTGGVGNRWQSD